MSKYKTQSLTEAQISSLPKALADEVRTLRTDSDGYADDLHEAFAANDADLYELAQKHLSKAAPKAKAAPKQKAPAKASKPAKAPKAKAPAKPKKDGRPIVTKEQLAQLKAERLRLADETEKEMAGMANMEAKAVLAKAKAFQQMRPWHSQMIDEGADHKNRLTPTPENLVRWMRNPGKFDLIGIDTFKENDPTADLRISKEVFWHRIGIRAK